MTPKNWMMVVVVALVAGAAGAGVALWSTSRETEEDEAKEAALPTASAGAAQTHDSATRISEDSARALALAQVPGGKVQGSELETEGGKLLYSFDIKVPGRAGIEEIHIGAMTGEVLSHEHESDSAEASEKARESGKAKKGDAE